MAALNNQQVTFAEFQKDVMDAVDEFQSITQLMLGDEMKELEPEKGLKLALIK